MHERELASAVTLLMILDRAADQQLWEMLLEAGVAEVISEIHMRAKDIPPAEIEVNILFSEHVPSSCLSFSTSNYFPRSI